MEDASEWNEDVTMHSAEGVPEAAPATDGAGVADTAEAAAGDDAEDDGFVRQLDEEWAEYRAEDGTLYYYNKVRMLPSVTLALRMFSHTHVVVCVLCRTGDR